MTQRIHNCPPDPVSNFNAIRSIGYDINRALADVIDNSIYSWIDGDDNNIPGLGTYTFNSATPSDRTGRFRIYQIHALQPMFGYAYVDLATHGNLFLVIKYKMKPPATNKKYGRNHNK